MYIKYSNSPLPTLQKGSVLTFFIGCFEYLIKGIFFKTGWKHAIFLKYGDTFLISPKMLRPPNPRVPMSENMLHRQ